jgi:hypothetical protein
MISKRLTLPITSPSLSTACPPVSLQKLLVHEEGTDTAIVHFRTSGPPGGRVMGGGGMTP